MISLFKRGERLIFWTATLGVFVWALFFYRAYNNLAIPAFGPAEQGIIAVRQLVIKYAGYLLAMGGIFTYGVHRMKKRQVIAGQRKKGTRSQRHDTEGISLVYPE